MDAPATTVRDPAELLDVHMHEVAGMRVFVAPDHGSGRPVHPGETIEAEPAQDPVRGGGSDAQSVGDAHWSELFATAQHLDTPLQRQRDLRRAPMGSARSVVETGRAFGLPAAPPLLRRLAAHAHLVSDVRDRTAGLDARDEEPSSRHGQFRVSVQASLLGSGAAGDVATPSPGGSPHVQSPAAVNNVRGHDN